MSLGAYQPGLGRLLLRARLRAGITQRELANLAGVASTAMISRYETGARAPSIDTLKALSDVLKVRTSDLLFRQGNYEESNN